MLEVMIRVSRYLALRLQTTNIHGHFTIISSLRHNPASLAGRQEGELFPDGSGQCAVAMGLIQRE
jgi:hypothetical protein